MRDIDRSVFIPKCILLLHFIILISQAGAQNYVINRLASNNRISDYYVVCAMKDNRGFMWFGTEDGLNRFDGYDFRIYKPVQTDTGSICGNYITSLADDGDYIWVGTLSGLSRYNKKTDSFKNYLHQEDINSLSHNNIKSVIRDSKGRIWVGTFNGLNLYNPRTDNFTRFFYTTNEGNYNQVYEIRTISESHNGNLWMGTTRGLFRFNTSTHLLTKLQFDRQIYTNNSSWIESVYEDEEHNLWIGSIGKGLFYYDDSSNRSWNYTQTTDPSSICSNEINTIAADAERNLWIGTNSGLSLVEKGNISDDRVIRFVNTFPSYDDQRISANVVSDIVLDNTNNLWICGRFNVIAVDRKIKQFTNINFVKTDPRFTTNNMSAIAEDKNGNIWFGTDGGGIYVWNRQQNNYQVYRHVPSDNKSIASDKVLALCFDSFDNLWIGYWAAGLDKLDLKTNKITHYRFSEKDPASLGGDNIYSLFEDSKKKLWIGLWSAGINSYNRDKDLFERVPDDLQYPESLVGYTVLSMFEDKYNNLFLSTEARGLKVLNTRTLKFRNFFPVSQDTNSISSNRLIHSYQDSKGRIWLCSQNGLNLFDPNSGNARKFFEKDGLSSNKTRYILEDDNGDLWISTDHGISRLTVEIRNNKEVYRFKAYDQDDGLQGMEFSKHSFCKTGKGEIIFGNQSGITMFSPDSIKDNLVIPPVVITRLNIMNKPVDVHSQGTVLKTDITETEELVLSYKHAVFSIEYSALNYSHSSKNKYAYKLEGFDRDWNYVGTERKATYTNLNPGSYVFRVKGSNNDGIWNEEGAYLKIRITPPWWKTLLFIILLGAFFLSVLVVFYIASVTRVRRKNELLERIVKQRTLEITRQKEEIEAQKSQLEKNNFRLMEQQNEMEAQTEELQSQTEELYSQTEALERSNIEIQRQHDDLETANKELNVYRNQLEQLVEERTRELIISKEKAEESDRLKSSFLSNLSHEIRTPLNAIIGFSSLLSDSDITGDEKDNYNFIIRQSSDTLLGLINDVIDFSKIESGHLDVYLAEVPVGKIIDKVNDTFNLELKKEPAEKRKAIDFRINVPPEYLTVLLYTDEMRLMQIIGNLINNAIKFTNQGFIEFGCKETTTDPWMEFYVRDTGIGIKKEDQSIVFQRFRKLEEDRSHLYRGAGLGLAISSELIYLLGGRIFLESEPGVGSVFSITVPVGNAGSESSKKGTTNYGSRENIQFPDFSGKNILVAEDDSTNYLYIEKLLRKTGANILHALNGLQVVSMANTLPNLHMVLMDIKMPRMDGMEALKNLRESGNAVPVVALTAYALSDEISRLREAGFEYYITKPVKMKEFFDALKTVLLEKR